MRNAMGGVLPPVAFCCCLLWFAPAAYGQCEPEDTWTGGAARNDYGTHFGDHTAFSDDWLVVGAPRELISFGYDGAAYVYRRGADGFEFHQKIEGQPTSRSPGAGERLGGGIFIDGDKMVVCLGSNEDFNDRNDIIEGDRSFAGQAAYYRHNAETDLWEEMGTMASNAPIPEGAFCGRTYSDPGSVQGRAFATTEGANTPRRVIHVFALTDDPSSPTERLQTVRLADQEVSPSRLHGFGNNLTYLHSGFLAVTDNTATDNGVVFIFRTDASGRVVDGTTRCAASGHCEPIQTLSAADASEFDDGGACIDNCPNENAPDGERYGYGFAFDGYDTFVVGASCDGSNPNGAVCAGSLYVYAFEPDADPHNPMRFVEEVYAEDADAFDQLGLAFGLDNAFATDGSLLLAGRGIAGFDGVGQVVAFERNDDGLFEQVGTIEPPNAYEGADFGNNIEIVGENILVSELGLSFIVPGNEARLHLYDRNCLGD